MIKRLFKIFKDKKKIVLILFSVTFILLIVNVIAARIFPNESDRKKDLSSVEINKKFIDGIKRFGLAEDWIVRKESKDKSSETSFSSYIISVPSDLPIPVLLSEVFNEFSGTSVSIISKELKPGGLSELEILTDGKKNLKANFDYQKTIHRKAGFIGFIIYDEGQMGEENYKLLNSSAEKLSFLFLPSYGVRNIIDSCKKEYALILNDEINDVDFKLQSGYSEKRLSESIRAIIKAFGNAVFFMIDDDASIFNSSKGKFIIDWLNKGKLKILFKNKIITLTSQFNIDDELKKILDSMSDGETKLIILSSSDYLSLGDEIMRYKKIGYKFINPSEVLQMH